MQLRVLERVAPSKEAESKGSPLQKPRRWDPEVDYLTSREVAKKVRSCVEVVRRWFRTGKLRAEKFRGRWQVHPDDLETFRAGNPEPRKREETHPIASGLIDAAVRNVAWG